MNRLLPLVLLLTLALIAGCDSGVAPGTAPDDEPPTVAFASSSVAVTEDDSLATLDVVLLNPDGHAVSVEVLYAIAASTAAPEDLNLSTTDLPSYAGGQAVVVETVDFPANAEGGTTRSITLRVTADTLIEEREEAVFALQNLRTQGAAELGETREATLSIGYPTLADAKAGTRIGDNVTVQATVIRIDGSTVYTQDETGGVAVFDDAVAAGVNVGDQVVVGGTLDVFAGLLEITGVGAEGFTVVSEGASLPDPQTATLADLIENGEKYVSTLVRVEGLTFADAGDTFSGGTNYSVSDGSGGAVELRVTDGSFYVDAPIPTGPVAFVGVLGQFNGDFEDDSSDAPDTGYQLLVIAEGDLSEE